MTARNAGGPFAATDILGGMHAATFLRRHWQKQPLLVRGALPGFGGVVDLAGMFDLACRDDCESRLVQRRSGRWSVEHGPFRPGRLARLPASGWTLLVQGLERVLPAARSLLDRFAFIPYSRLDDLMVSYAPAGGGVGPHFDSYDVFLLQGPGRRRWKTGRQRDLALVADAPLKILQRFAPEGECVLSPGDMLYLPPECAHDGVAVDACYTYSIGFRAPSHRELISGFLAFLEDRADGEGRYGDPDLRSQRRPARLGTAMAGKVERVLRSIEWTRRDVGVFLGLHLTEPAAGVAFAGPARPLTPRAFTAAARRGAVALAGASRMLYEGPDFFINGECHAVAGGSAALRTLADTRRLPGAMIAPRGAPAELLYQWYRAGYICLHAPRAAR
ncbi:MAG TPA: cupin domain-containing protein [Burkholderiales bacterium]|nr:cupin domain-containing protein [Burkholderiales bacterium]